jgi:hypothetical protein
MVERKKYDEDKKIRVTSQPPLSKFNQNLNYEKIYVFLYANI